MDQTTWQCEYCSPNSHSNKSGFAVKIKNQADFVKHLRTFHLARDSKKNGTIWQCKYGQGGVCRAGSMDNSPDSTGPISSSLASEQDYETHLVRYHLSQMRNKRSQPGVSNVEMPRSALTYPEIREQQKQHESKGQGDHGSVGGKPGLLPSSATNNLRHQCQSQRQPTPEQNQPWNIYHSVVNLPAVLNDPRHRQTDIFSRTWGDSFERAEVVPSPYLHTVSTRHFERYLSRVCSRLNRGGSAPGRRSAPVGVDTGDGHTQPSDSPSPPTRQVFATHEVLQSQADLETIPKMFFHSSFSLENEGTFSTVLPLQTGTRRGAVGESGDRRLVNYQPLHDKLSHYLDLVEVQIAKQVSRKSAAFFEAVRSHDTVRDKLTQTLDQIKLIRSTMRTLDDVMVSDHLKVLRLARRKRNYELLYDKLKLVMTVHAAQPTIQTLLATSDFCGALDLIATTQELVENELAGLHCFRHLGAQLTEMARFVDKMVQAELVSVVQQHLDWPGGGDVSGAGAMVEDDQLTPCILGMLRINRLNFVEIYRMEANQRIKDLVKGSVIKAVSCMRTVNPDPFGSSYIPNENEDRLSPVTGGHGPPSLAEQMRQLGYEEWMKLLQDICRGLSRLLRRIDLGCESLAGTLSRCSSPMSDLVLAPEVIEALQEEVSRSRQALLSTAQERLVKVVNARAKDGFLEKLNSAQFVRLSRVLEDFQTVFRESGQGCPLLRSAVQSQAVRLVTRFHEERRNKLTLILDNERWKAADVPPEFQELADYIKSSGSLGLPDRRPSPSVLQQPPADPLQRLADAAGQSQPANDLMLSGRRFVVAGTVLLLFKMLAEYCQCAEDIPSVSPEVLLRLVELLKLFNSRTCQLVLGAGALQLVGLKTISTKNLALSSSCLQVVLQLLPLVRTLFRDRLLVQAASAASGEAVPPHTGSQRCLKHLDQVEKLYRDHVSEIASKLVLIAESSLRDSVSNWRVRPPSPSQEIRNVCRLMGKLHEAIAEVLPTDQITELFLRIHNKFKTLLREQLKHHGVANDNGPQHGLVVSELAFYMKNLRALPGLGMFTDEFADLWQHYQTQGQSSAYSHQEGGLPTPCSNLSPSANTSDVTYLTKTES